MTPTPTPEGNGKKVAIDAGHQAHGNGEQEPNLGRGRLADESKRGMTWNEPEEPQE
ncbi:MAG: hypothetical protein ACLSHW_05015 [Lachnospiraceae bacterium]